eukprot:6463985-Amphidinium_carterae.1
MVTCLRAMCFPVRDIHNQSLLSSSIKAQNPGHCRERQQCYMRRERNIGKVQWYTRPCPRNPTPPCKDGHLSPWLLDTTTTGTHLPSSHVAASETQHQEGEHDNHHECPLLAMQSLENAQSPSAATATALGATRMRDSKYSIVASQDRKAQRRQTQTEEEQDSQIENPSRDGAYLDTCNLEVAPAAANLAETRRKTLKSARDMP